MQAVRAHFRPEFLNRLDEIILFHRLSRMDMDRIVDIQIARLSKLHRDALHDLLSVSHRLTLAKAGG